MKIWVVLLLLKVCSCQNRPPAAVQHLIIQESGVTNTDVGSTALVFCKVYEGLIESRVLYTQQVDDVLVRNSTPNDTMIEIIDDHCCFEEEKHKMECNVMKLYGGFSGMMLHQSTIKVDFIYPTLYPHDMVGFCCVIVKFDAIVHHVNITFNTTLVEKKPVSWLPYFINEFLFDIPIPRRCESRDEDRFKQCTPVLCDIKYHGHRNFFDLESEMCVPVVNCKGNSDDKSSKVYDSMTNTCKDDKTTKKSHDKEKLEEEHEYKDEDVDWTVERRLDCNHGDLAANKSMCICNHGYTSLELPDQEIRDGALQMCTLHAKGYIDTAIIGVAFAASIIVILHIANYIWRQQRKKHLSDDFPEGEYKAVLAESSQFSVDYYETALEYEKANICKRCLRGLCQMFRSNQQVKLDYSMEEINIGETLLTPVPLIEDHEVD